MKAETADLLRPTLRSLLAESDGRDFLRRLVELGWDDVAADDPEAATALLFEAQGRSLVSTAALDLVVLSALEPLDDPVAVLHPHPESRQTTPGTLTTCPPPGRLEISGVALGRLEGSATLVVPVVADGSVACFLLDGRATPLETVRVDGLAPELDLVHMRGTVDTEEVRLLRTARWSDAVAAARRALAHELNGISAVMVELAVDHAVNRIQFGHPIGKFQAIQHRLADCHVALEAARTAAAQAGESGGELASAAAKALAGNAFRVAARHCQQVFGAIGFTWEHPFHFALRRGMVLELLYGSGPQLRQELGQAIKEGDQPFRQLVSL